MNTIYEKPQMKYVAMRNEEKIAGTCWGHHSDGTTMYADIPGPGYCSFQIGGKKCDLALVNVKYVKKVRNPKTGEYEMITSDPTSVQVAELNNILASSGGSSGNSYSGEGTIVMPEPDPKWS